MTDASSTSSNKIDNLTFSGGISMPRSPRATTDHEERRSGAIRDNWSNGRTKHTNKGALTDAVRFRENFRVVLHALLIFNLAVDLDVVLSQDFTDLADVGRLADEGGRDEVHSVLDAPVDDVVDVLLGQRGQVDDHAGEVLR